MSSMGVKTSPKKKFNYGWVVIGAFMAIDSMIMGVTFSLGLMLPLISNDLGMSLGQTGWLGSMNWEISAIFTIPVAYRLSRYDPKLLITLSYVGAAAFLFAQGLAPNYWVLMITRIAYISVGLARFAAKPNLIQQWFPREKIAMVNSLLSTGMGVASGVVVFFMGAIIGGLDGWRNTFYIFGIASVVLLFAWMILGRENPESPIKAKAKEKVSLGPLLKNKTLWLLGIGVTGDMLCFGAMETMWPKYAVSHGFITLDQAGYAEGLSYWGFTVGSFLGGFMSMKLGRRQPVLWLSGLILPFVTLGILYSQSFVMLAILWTLWGVAELYFPVIMTIPYELPGIKPQEVAVASGFVFAVFTAGAGLGPLFAGYLADAFGDLKMALFATCLFPVLLLITGFLIMETGPKGAHARKAAADQATADQPAP